MKINQLKIKNFRCYEDLTLNFHNQLTVLVAINGEGKTTVLDAIKAGLWPFLSQFEMAVLPFSNQVSLVSKDDIRTIPLDKYRIAQQFPCIISLNLELLNDKHNFIIKKDKTTFSNDNQLLFQDSTNLIELGKIMQQELNSIEFYSKTFPIFCFYGVNRSYDSRVKEREYKNFSFNEKNTRSFAYQNNLNPAFNQFEDWYTYIFKVAREQQIKALEQDKQLKLEETEAYQLIKAIQQAVDIVLQPLGWQQLEYSEQHAQSLIIYHQQQGIMKLSQLSDGIKNMLAMVADIAYRCVLLNGHLGKLAAQKTPGLVMIDEVDLHLHPQWQQTILDSLIKAFPKLQFIVTTHSPQVLTTTPSDTIRIINEGKVYGAPKGSQGAEATRLLKTIFQVEPRPPLQENTKSLERYIKLVYADKWASEEAKSLRKTLDAIFGNEEPKLFELDLYIENKIWEQELEES